VYASEPGQRRRNGSPRYCTTWMLIYFGQRFPGSSGMRRLGGWTDMAGVRAEPGSQLGWICMRAFTVVAYRALTLTAQVHRVFRMGSGPA